MEHTFMTIHNLSPDANILFASDSILEILGYHPHEVLGRSCFDYFHPDELPFAKSIHSRGVMLDKAAVLHYARIRSRDGQWIGCECCFTVVHDVLVACTSIYRIGEKSQKRAMDAPLIRRIFSCSPRDPRYHMLEHLSSKFKLPAPEREPRAALIVNRFTRTLTVMFATNAIANILGVSPEQIKGKSFYECIQSNCLDDAIRCLESAKANDSIAYLRFWSRDPRRPEDFESEMDEMDVDGSDGTNSRERTVASEISDDSDSGGAPLGNNRRQFEGHSTANSNLTSHTSTPIYTSNGSTTSDSDRVVPNTVHSNGEPAIQQRVGQTQPQRPLPSVELEAVVSCTSDGLVVILRRARPITQISQTAPFTYENGLFAAPWGQTPIRPQYPPEMLHTFHAPYLPEHMPVQPEINAAGGPPLDQLMASIRDVAVFAWALVGINGNLAKYTTGVPRGEAQPPEGLPVWDPRAQPGSYLGPENQAVPRWSAYAQRFPNGHGRPMLGDGFESLASVRSANGTHAHSVHRDHTRPRTWQTHHITPVPGVDWQQQQQHHHHQQQQHHYHQQQPPTHQQHYHHVAHSHDSNHYYTPSRANNYYPVGGNNHTPQVNGQNGFGHPQPQPYQINQHDTDNPQFSYDPSTGSYIPNGNHGFLNGRHQW